MDENEEVKTVRELNDSIIGILLLTAAFSFTGGFITGVFKQERVHQTKLNHGKKSVLDSTYSDTSKPSIIGEYHP
jgi:hypothetical protein